MDDRLTMVNSRLGLYYFPDTTHYRESDLRAWIPELRAIGASWLTLVAPVDRAIPEIFLKGLLSAGITPILHFPLPIDTPVPPEKFQLLFESYARWGIDYVVLYDRPNRRKAWSLRDWSQKELVERFLDFYLPLAEAAQRNGLTPVFPPLEPGGDYWDTAFLRTALQTIQRRGHEQLLRHLVIGAYAWVDNRSLNWGAGGPERWPGARPYQTPLGEEDQRGFRIFDWYLAITKAVLGRTLPILILGTGCRIGDQSDSDEPAIDPTLHSERNLTLAQLLLGNPLPKNGQGPVDPLPTEVLAANFWLLSATADSPHIPSAWFKPDGQTLPIVGALRQWLADSANEKGENSPFKKHAPSKRQLRPIAHYLLLPTYEWGVSDWHLEVIRPFVKAHRPAVGFSLVEAALATRVTVVGGSEEFPEEVLEDLRTTGCYVERIQGNGTSIASQLDNT